MAFRNAYESHEHSLQILDLIYGYDSFLDSLSVVADFGCGAGLDTEWWATLETRDDPPEPRNYLVYGVDKNISQVDDQITKLPNVKLIQGDFEDDALLPRKCDMIWCHDAFQYTLNPLKTLRSWNKQMNKDGMLVISLPQNIHYQYNRLQNNCHNGVYYNHNIATLMYMLAVNGFDCRDAYFYKNMNDPWLYAAVYKSDISPMDPASTTWMDLVEQNLVNDSVKESVNKYNYLRQEDIVTVWFDRDFYRISE